MQSMFSFSIQDMREEYWVRVSNGSDLVFNAKLRSLNFILHWNNIFGNMERAVGEIDNAGKFVKGLITWGHGRDRGRVCIAASCPWKAHSIFCGCWWKGSTLCALEKSESLIQDTVLENPQHFYPMEGGLWWHIYIIFIEVEKENLFGDFRQLPF